MVTAVEKKTALFRFRQNKKSHQGAKTLGGLRGFKSVVNDY